MGKINFIQVFFSLIPLLLLAPLLGNWMANVYEGKGLVRRLSFLEGGLYRMIGISPDAEMDWWQYTVGILGFNFIGFLFLFLMLMFQGHLPLNPQMAPNMTWDLALNTAMSFITNTNWQAYTGETQASSLSQMVGFGVQNFLSAGTGMAVMVAFSRAFSRKETDRLGNCWVDLVRSVIWILLPLSFVFALILVSQGVIQNFLHPIAITTLEGKSQILSMGPAASQIAIKQLGTNGGGFFGANSAHPFENPTPFSNWLELIAILLIPAAFPFTFGRMIQAKKQGYVLFAAMFILLVGMLMISLFAEPHFLMEGKETRLGVTHSVIWSVFTSAASNGSVNAMHSSLSPIAGGIACLNMLLGEVIFGGVGCGLYGLIHFAILTVFLAGLMVGRTPEYLSKKIEVAEVKYNIFAILISSVCVLVGSALTFLIPSAMQAMSTQGPHGLTEVLYNFASTSNNNGSAFAGMNANTVFFNVAFTICMFMGRFGIIIPTLAVAGSLVRKKATPPSIGTFKTDSGLFVALLIGVILIVGALTFFPALTLGPILEALL